MTWARATVDADGWRDARSRRWRAAGGPCVGLWGEPGAVRMATQRRGRASASLSCACPRGAYPSVGARHAPAIRLERALADLPA